MNKLKKKENIIIIVILVVMILAIIGVSYAAFNFQGLGQRENKITTGAISMTYTESDNTISLGNALPTTDKTGTTRLKEGEYFDFTVSSEITGDVNINYEVSAKEVGEGTIDGSNIKLYLTEITDDGEEQLMSPEVYNEESSANDYTGRPSGEMSLYTSSMNSSEEHHYRLRMYVTEEYNPQGDGGGLTFTVQVNVYGKAGDKMPVTTGPANEVLLSNISEDNQYDDGTDTFITGEDPNNYIWYSGKLWRAVSVNNEEKTTKLVTQWNISAINYNEEDNTTFEGSYMEDWLNDTSVDGFLGNLRDYENFIVTDAKWNATMDSTSLGSIERPNDDGTIVTDAVGLLNMYEYQSSNNVGTDGYLNNGLSWWTLTPSNASRIWEINYYGSTGYFNGSFPDNISGVRPSINLKSSVRIVDGDGTIDNPYRLNGDNDTNLSGTLLSSRYSGEYIKFGSGENNLYRIVSHENGTGTKITSDEPLKDSGAFKTINFGSDIYFSNTNTIGAFLNGEYLTNYVGDNYSNMIEDSTIWYLGTVGSGSSYSYKNAKYTDASGTTTTSSVTKAKVGLLRFGELMSGQFEKFVANDNDTELTTSYWTLTPYSMPCVLGVNSSGTAIYVQRPYDSDSAIRPSMNLKQNVIINGGDGTKNNPFTIELG